MNLSDAHFLPLCIWLALVIWMLERSAGKSPRFLFTFLPSSFSIFQFNTFMVFFCRNRGNILSHNSPNTWFMAHFKSIFCPAYYTFAITWWLLNSYLKTYLLSWETHTHFQLSTTVLHLAVYQSLKPISKSFS